MCENYGQSCENCLRNEVTRKLGDDGSLPHFSVDRIYLHSKPVITEPKPMPGISVFYVTPRGEGEIFGPFFRFGERGRLISRQRAEELAGCEALSEKIERAYEAASNRELSK
jgi:hypothetical protein